MFTIKKTIHWISFNLLSSPAHHPPDLRHHLSRPFLCSCSWCYWDCEQDHLGLEVSGLFLQWDSLSLTCSDSHTLLDKLGLPVKYTVPTCWERERGMAGIATEAPGVAPPREKVMLWEALSVACGLVSWWLTPPIRSKSSVEGGAVLEAGVDWTLPNRSVTGWAGPELDETGVLVEKAFQSPNSPFPLDRAAAGHKRVVIGLVVILTRNNCVLNLHSYSTNTPPPP